jgi:hypothetical protein
MRFHWIGNTCRSPIAAGFLFLAIVVAMIAIYCVPSSGPNGEGAAGVIEVGPPKPRANPSTTLDPRVLEMLGLAAREWVAARLASAGQGSSGRKRTEEDRRDEFQSLIRDHAGEGGIESKIGDLLRIFQDVFSYDAREHLTGLLETRRVMLEDSRFWIRGPSDYSLDCPYPSVLILRAGAGEASAKQWIEMAWGDGGAVVGEPVFLVAPKMDHLGDLDSVVSRGLEDQRAEDERIQRVLAPYGQVQRTYRLDRRRRILDCGPGACGFGMRLATYFPNLFAGVILRDPVDLGALRLLSLHRMSVLLVSRPGNEAVCERIVDGMRRVNPASVTVVRCRRTRHGDQGMVSIERIQQWLKTVRRPLFPELIIVAPTHDRFGESDWVELLAFDPLDVTGANPPWVSVRADYARDRIIIRASGVHEIGLHLNDALLDLNNEITFLLNGIEIAKHSFSRSIDNVVKQIVHTYDASRVYTQSVRLSVPNGEIRVVGK